MAPVGWAVAATLVSVFVAPTLYNYPKVLILSAAALTIARYCRRPHVLGVVAGSVLTAVAFLFRHDLAVYAGVGLLPAYVIGSHRTERVRRACMYVALTVVLLAPSLVWVQRYAGLVQYVRDGLALSADEAERTDLSSWPRFTRLDESGNAVGIMQFFAVEQNGTAWLYYVTRLLPFAAVALVWVRRAESESAGARIGRAGHCRDDGVCVTADDSRQCSSAPRGHRSTVRRARGLDESRGGTMANG